MTNLHYEDNKAILQMNHLVRCLVDSKGSIVMHEHMMSFSEKNAQVLVGISDNFVKNIFTKIHE